MNARMAWSLCLLVLTAAGFAVFSLSHGQDRPPQPIQPIQPITYITSSTPAPPVRTLQLQPAATLELQPPPARDLSKYSLLQRQMHLNAQRGADWLLRANRADGRFMNGLQPALKAVLEGDHYLRQVGAAFALAKMASFNGDERYAAVARQAVLTLLLETVPNQQDANVRHTASPSLAINRLAAAGMLVLAVNALPHPGEDLLTQSEQLCNFIRGQQRPDGSLQYVDGDAPRAETDDPEGIESYPGQALYGLMCSQKNRPAPWKTEVVRKALAFYRPWWKTHKSMAFVPWQSAANTEAYVMTKEKPFADFVNEMNDWLGELQFVNFDARHPLWTGGFMSWSEGKAQAQPPQVISALYVEGLVEACRVARQAGDLARYQRARDAAERCLQFLTTLQYSEANTQHFAEWYRPSLLGGFYASHQDGNLRIDYTQHALCALVNYLTYLPEAN